MPLVISVRTNNYKKVTYLEFFLMMQPIFTTSKRSAERFNSIKIAELRAAYCKRWLEDNGYTAVFVRIIKG